MLGAARGEIKWFNKWYVPHCPLPPHLPHVTSRKYLGRHVSPPPRRAACWRPAAGSWSSALPLSGRRRQWTRYSVCPARPPRSRCAGICKHHKQTVSLYLRTLRLFGLSVCFWCWRIARFRLRSKWRTNEKRYSAIRLEISCERFSLKMTSCRHLYLIWQVCTWLEMLLYVA